MNTIVAEGLVKIYQSRKNEVRALDGLDLTVEQGMSSLTTRSEIRIARAHLDLGGGPARDLRAAGRLALPPR